MGSGKPLKGFKYKRYMARFPFKASQSVDCLELGCEEVGT
jgi:hypothetical protein